MSSAPESSVSLDLLFVVDPLDSLNAAHDTSVALMEAAQTRGHRVAVATVRDLEIDGGRAVAAVRSVELEPAVLVDARWSADDRWYRVDPSIRRPLEEFDAVFMRTDPPVDAEYLRATYILDLVDAARTIMINRPAGLRNANEKLFALRVPGIGPETLVSADIAAIVARVGSWGRAVLKPTDAMAGRGVVVLGPDDVNLRSLLESATDRGRRQVVVQRWIPDAEVGDRRVIVLDGEPLGVVRRVAGESDFRCNMAAGAAPVADHVTARDREICAALAPHLREHGLLFAGIDVIGGLLTEVNVTSPTGIREIDALSGTDLAGDIVAWVEKARADRFASSSR